MALRFYLLIALILGLLLSSQVIVFADNPIPQDRVETASFTSNGGQGTFTRVSRSPYGLPHTSFLRSAPYPCGAFSNDARYIALCTQPEVYGYTAEEDSPIFILDRVRHTVENIPPLPQISNHLHHSIRMDMSEDGRYLVFSVVVGDTNYDYSLHLYLYELDTKVLSQILEFESTYSDLMFQGQGTFDLSADGRFLVIVLPDLIASENDNSGYDDIVRYEIGRQQFQLISNGFSGTPANGDSREPVISGDGSVIAFTSAATNLVPNDIYGFCDTNQRPGNCPDIFVWDESQPSQLTLVSKASDGTPANFASGFPAISSDGQRVAFVSAAFNLDPRDRNNGNGCGRLGDDCSDIFVHDRNQDYTILVSRHPETREQGGRYGKLLMSSDGRFIVAETEGNILPRLSDYYNCERWGCQRTTDTIRIDTITGAVIPLTPKPDGNSAFGENFLRAFSGNGEWLLFTTTAGELWSGDTPSSPSSPIGERFSDPDLGLRYIPTGGYTRLTTAPSSGGNGDSMAPAFTPDGNTVIYTTSATNLAAPQSTLLYNRVTKTTQSFQVTNEYSQSQAIRYRFNSTGTAVAFYIPNPDAYYNKVHIVDLTKSTNQAINQYWASHPEINKNIDMLAFQSAEALTPLSDTNNVNDIYINNLEGEYTLISRTAEGLAGNYASTNPVFNPDGGSVVYVSSASTIIMTDTNNYLDLYEYDFATEQTRLLSVAAEGGLANGNSTSPRFATGSQNLAFVSTASNLVLSDTNMATDVFLLDLEASQIELISQGSDGTLANGDSSNPVITPDGRFVAFVSSASNLVPNDADGNEPNIFLRDRQLGTTTLLSVLPDGTDLKPNLEYFDIAPDGRAFVFSTYLGLTPDDSASCDLNTDMPRQCADIYIWEMDGVPLEKQIYIPILQR